MITHLRILVLFFVSIAGLASCKAITNEITLGFKDSITFLASPDLTIRIYEGSMLKKEFTGKGYEVADSLIYRAQTSEDCTISLHGKIENLVLLKNIDSHYGKGFEYYGKPKTLIIFTQTATYFDNDRMNDLRCMIIETGKNIRNLTVDKNKKLEELRCSGTGLEVLDVSKNKKLRVLFCASNELGKIDVHRNKNLEKLVCFDNEMTELDVSKNKKLKFLSCDNPLRELNIRHNKNLEDLICRAELTSIDISKNRKLISIILQDNNFSTEELDRLIGNLPTLAPDEGAIALHGNPGYKSYDYTLLKKNLAAKGWWHGIRVR